jgi:hypothetical protein
MEVRRFEAVDALLEVAGGFLGAREAQHNLIFGICSNIQASPGLYGETPPYMAAVLHGSNVVAAAIRTPPWRLVLSEIDHPTAVQLLAADLEGEELPGVQGPAAVAARPLGDRSPDSDPAPRSRPRSGRPPRGPGAGGCRVLVREGMDPQDRDAGQGPSQPPDLPTHEHHAAGPCARPDARRDIG